LAKNVAKLLSLFAHGALFQILENDNKLNLYYRLAQVEERNYLWQDRSAEFRRVCQILKNLSLKKLI
jgi:hypothetical protein